MRRRPDSGASLVEFALILPLLVLFLFGIVQFGIAYDKEQSINSAAREGARAAAIPVTTVAQIRAVVDSSYQSVSSSGAVTTVITVNGVPYDGATQKPCESNAGNTVVVQATTDHTLTIPFFGTWPRQIEGEGEFRCERSA